MEPPSTRPPEPSPAWPLKDADALRDTLLAAYLEPGRRFHGAGYLRDVLDAIAELERAGNAFDPLAVRLAAWFHRCVYVGERDDAERSAVRAEDDLTGTVGPAVIGEVARLVRATETFLPEPGDANAAALSDAALRILTTTPERYDDYVRDVRREYPHLSDEEFRDGRAHVVEGLLARPRIFHCEHGCEAWEAAARANLERELATLARVAVRLQ